MWEASSALTYEAASIGKSTPPASSARRAAAAHDAYHLESENIERDRLVILGRRAAGKTIYLARLYEQLWNGRDDVRMRAASGSTHTAFMQISETLANGSWPQPTTDSQYADFEFTSGNDKRTLTTMDYPGDIFHNAFVEDADDDAAQRLLNHIDRAAMVILLLDPNVAVNGSASEITDDEFGMAQALRRIRQSKGGQHVPVAIVFTKCDLYQDLVKEDGGLKNFVAHHYENVVREAGAFRIFPSAAVFMNRKEDGTLLPDVERKPVGLVEPVAYCLRHLQAAEQQAAQQRAAAQQARAAKLAVVTEPEPEIRSSRPSGILVSLVVFVIAAVIFGGGLLVLNQLKKLKLDEIAPRNTVTHGDEPERNLSGTEAQLDAVYKQMTGHVCRVIVRVSISASRGEPVWVPASHGTGFVVSKDGMIVTNQHVVATGREIVASDPYALDWDVVCVFNHREPLVLHAEDIEESNVVDLAWFRVPHSFPNPLQFAATPAPGTTAFCYGYPGLADELADGLNDTTPEERWLENVKRARYGANLSVLDWIGEAGLTITTTRGIVSSIRDTEQGRIVITDAFVHEGNSGGPLVNEHGQVIGIATWRVIGIESTNICIASWSIYQQIRKLQGINWPTTWR